MFAVCVDNAHYIWARLPGITAVAATSTDMQTWEQSSISETWPSKRSERMWWKRGTRSLTAYWQLFRQTSVQGICVLLCVTTENKNMPVNSGWSYLRNRSVTWFRSSPYGSNIIYSTTGLWWGHIKHEVNMNSVKYTSPHWTISNMEVWTANANISNVSYCTGERGLKKKTFSWNEMVSFAVAALYMCYIMWYNWCQMLRSKYVE